jgi:hypothetical protein
MPNSRELIGSVAAHLGDAGETCELIIHIADDLLRRH